MRYVHSLLSLIFISLFPFSAESSYQPFEIDIEELQEISPRPGTRITDKNFPLALDFKRKANNFNPNIYHHLGIYAYKPKILKKLVNFEQTNNEIKNRLEQLRALDNKIKINVALAKFCPIGVDTMEDYLALKKKLEYNS